MVISADRRVVYMRHENVSKEPALPANIQLHFGMSTELKKLNFERLVSESYLKSSLVYGF
jgi:hypothetical protein